MYANNNYCIWNFRQAAEIRVAKLAVIGIQAFFMLGNQQIKIFNTYHTDVPQVVMPMTVIGMSLFYLLKRVQCECVCHSLDGSTSSNRNTSVDCC